MNAKNRALNNLDKAYLEEIREAIGGGRWLIDEFIWSGLWIYGVMGIVISLVWATICRLVGILPSMYEWQDEPIVYQGVILIFALTAIQFIWRFVKGHRHRQGRLERLALELNHNEVEETMATVEEIKCFQEPEHLGKIYLLRLSDGRIRVRYDYDSVDVEGRGKSARTNYPISREMTMIHFKHLDEFRYDFGPTKIRKPPAQLLNVSLDDCPEDETWLDIPWEDLDSRYAR